VARSPSRTSLTKFLYLLQGKGKKKKTREGEKGRVREHMGDEVASQTFLLFLPCEGGKEKRGKSRNERPPPSFPMKKERGRGKKGGGKEERNPGRPPPFSSSLQKGERKGEGKKKGRKEEEPKALLSSKREGRNPGRFPLP